MRRRVRGAWATTVAVVLAVACSDTGAEDTSTVRQGDATSITTTTVTTTTTTTTSAADAPGADWPRADATAAGFDPSKLAEVAAVAEAAASSCVMVVRDGRVVVEEYWDGFGPDDDIEIFSATKSVTSVLVGIAADLGDLSIDEPASRYLTEWVGTPSESVTIRQLLSNTSGRYHDMTTDYADLTTASDRSAFAIGLSQAVDPDTSWVYNNAAIQTLEEVLERATGTDVAEFAQEHLFGPLGMDVRFLRDLAGNPSVYFGLQAGCSDMARFSLMVARQGRWGDRRIVSAEHLAESTSPSSGLRSSYGLLWWLNAPGEEGGDAFWPHAPLDAYAALGMGQQIVMVMPSQDTVVVRLGRLGGPAADLSQQFAVVDQLAAAVTAADVGPAGSGVGSGG